MIGGVTKSRKKTEATYLALRLAVILEQFVGQCAYRSWHDEVDLSEGRELGHKLPTLACYLVIPHVDSLEAAYKKLQERDGFATAFDDYDQAI
jgi:hypothetical protein